MPRDSDGMVPHRPAGNIFLLLCFSNNFYVAIISPRPPRLLDGVEIAVMR